MDGRLAELRVDKNSPDYHAGVHEGRRQERGNWVQAMDLIGVADKLAEQIIGKVAELYGE